MTTTDETRKDLKGQLKALRETRKSQIQATAALAKTQKKAISAIKALLAEKAATVPEIADATGMRSSQALWYLAALKKYGVVMEAEKDGSYFRYRLSGANGPAANSN